MDKGHIDEVPIRDESIRLGQFLKLANLIELQRIVTNEQSRRAHPFPFAIVIKFKLKVTAEDHGGTQRMFRVRVWLERRWGWHRVHLPAHRYQPSS